MLPFSFVEEYVGIQRGVRKLQRVPQVGYLEPSVAPNTILTFSEKIRRNKDILWNVVVSHADKDHSSR